jgi:hypothetical protein
VTITRFDNTSPGIRLGEALLLVVSLALAACASPAAVTSEATSAPEATIEPTALPSLTPTPAVTVDGVYVDPAMAVGEISPLVYGTNYGPWLFVPLEVQPLAEEAGLNIIRYPGGNWGDRNDMDEWNLDQFVALARQFEAEPYIHVRLLNGSPEQAAGVVRMLNIDKGYGIRFWSIGNEPNLFGDGYDSQTYVREWREWALAMEAVDPSIQLIGPEVNQFTAYPDNDYERELERWMVEFLQANGDLVDIVAFHRYPFPSRPNDPPPAADDLRAASEEWDVVIPYVRALVREHTGKDLPIGVTEANSSWAFTSGGETTLDSHLNAIWWGDSLGRMIRQGAYMVNQFAIIGDFGLMDKYEPYPIYFVYIMYKNFGTERLLATSSDPMVSVFAAKREDGAITVMLVNRAAEAKEVPLTVEGLSTSLDASAILFDHEHNAEAVDDVTIGADFIVTMTPESMLLLTFPAP